MKKYKYLRMLLRDILIFVFIVWLTCFTIYSVDRRICKDTAYTMGYNYSYKLTTRCMLQVEETKWVPLESYYYKEK